jgi:hypothetical protein
VICSSKLNIFKFWLSLGLCAAMIVASSAYAAEPSKQMTAGRHNTALYYGGRWLDFSSYKRFSAAEKSAWDAALGLPRSMAVT